MLLEHYIKQAQWRIKISNQIQCSEDCFYLRNIWIQNLSSHSILNGFSSLSGNIVFTAKSVEPVILHISDLLISAHPWDATKKNVPNSNPGFQSQSFSNHPPTNTCLQLTLDWNLILVADWKVLLCVIPKLV